MIPTLLLTAGVTVSLPATVEVRGTELLVGSIAEVHGEDEDLVARVEAASLGYAPAPGFSRLLDHRRVAAEIARRLPGVEVAMAGAPRCRVHPAVRTVTAARLLEEAGDALRARFEGQDAKVTHAGDVADLRVPAPREAVELRAELRRAELRAGSWSVPVEVVVDGAVHRRVWTRWDVALWERRHVLRRDVAAGEDLAPEDLELVRIPVEPGPTRRALDPSALAGAVARRGLERGSVVTTRDVERRVVVERGDTLSLEIRRGAVTVRALAVAEGDARVGDRLPVRLERTGKRLVAVVSGPETVELRLP